MAWGDDCRCCAQRAHLTFPVPGLNSSWIDPSDARIASWPSGHMPPIASVKAVSRPALPCSSSFAVIV